MDVTQVYTLVNNATTEVLGSALLKEDLTNVVDVGEAVFNASAYDKYVKSLVNHIGKVIFVARKYRGGVPSVLMDAWEFGSVLEKISATLPDATENESWELEDQQSYDVNVFYKPSVTAKFYNKMITFEIPMSFTEKQVRQSFSSATQLNAFISMIYTAVDNSMSVKMDALIMRTINNMIGETLHDAYPSATYTTAGNVRAVNLLKLYNDASGTSLTRAVALKNLDFLKFASEYIGLTIGRMGKMSKLFNVGQKERFTPKDMLHCVLLSDFAKASTYYLQSDTFHKELVALPNYDEVPYWQGSGETYALDDVSKVYIKTSGGNDVECSGIIGVLFDHDALGVCNEDRRTTTNYNAKAEFYTNWYKFDCRYFNDLNENFVVFIVA